MNHTSLQEAFYANGTVEDCPVYDLHAHMGPHYGIAFPRPTAEGMIHAMDRAGVKLLVLCHHDTLLAPDIGNVANVEAVRRYPHRLRAYCGINPNYPGDIKRDLDAFDEY